jgi:glycosyltransferase involved in cell wall biosynthesis
MAEDDASDFTQCDVLLMWNNPGYFPKTQRRLLGMPKNERPPVVVMFGEPLPPPRASGISRWSSLNKAEIAKILLRDWRATDIYSNERTLRRLMKEGLADILFVIGGEQEEYAAENGYGAIRFEYGYHPNFGDLMGLERDIDVLFLGETRPRRRRKFLDQLRRDGVDVTVRGSWHAKSEALWGAERTRFLNRTKILVHLQRYPGKVASKRFVLAMANGAFVISEPSYRPDPFVPGKHFISARVEEMPDLIRHYLAHPEEMAAITSEAHRFVTEELTWRRTMEGVVQAIEARFPEMARK